MLFMPSVCLSCLKICVIPCADSRPEEERWILENDWEKAQLDDATAAEGLAIQIEREKVVVVTGVSSGIGHATVKSLLDQGCHVFGR